jgi:hypothetical protein
MTDHPYNAPGISPHELFLAIMHDPDLDLPTRIKAAEHLMRLGLGHIGTIRTIKIKIEGGMPFKPLESFPEEMQRDLLWLKRCWELRIVDPNLEDLLGRPRTGYRP